MIDRKYILFSFFILYSITCLADNPPRRHILMDKDWKFIREDVSGSESMIFDDSKWRNIDLPHDYSIEDLPGKDSPFSPDAITGIHGGFTTGGTAWYRKTFDLSVSDKDKIVTILFEGVYMNADVWINGNHIGNNIYGYTPFSFDITKYLVFGGKNTISVQVKNEGVSARWYTGSGIYRHVWLKIMDPIHIIENGIFITTPVVESDQAQIKINSLIANQSETNGKFTILTEIEDVSGKIVANHSIEKKIPPNSIESVEQLLTLNKPSLWSPDSPSLYKAKITIKSKDVNDIISENFGIRTITMDAQNGFLINGTPLLLKGGCVHHDNGPLGSKAYDRAEERRVELLKASGYNSVRCAHNPPSKAFLEACDRLGLLVIDEAVDMWNDKKTDNDYALYFKDDWKNIFRAMVERDRNHPSIFLWSIGNEIPNIDTPEVVAVAKELKEFILTLDGTRKITAGINNLHSKVQDFLSVLDVVGMNYAINNRADMYKRYTELYPDMVMYGSESYALDQFKSWKAVEKYPSVIGDYVWTGIDYIGEASIGWNGYPQKKEFYPWNLAYCGDIDICGWKRPQSYYKDTFWNKNSITIAVQNPVKSLEYTQERKETWSRWNYDDVLFDWNWEGMEEKPMNVDIYSSTKEVELFLNGKSLGRKIIRDENMNKISYMVPYERGILKAIGHNENGKTIEQTLKSSDKAKNIKVTLDRTAINVGGQDLCYVTVELQDENGILDPKAENQLYFSIEGDASIVAVGNAKPTSTESYTQPTRKAWRGKCMVIVKAGYSVGDIVFTVKANGFKNSSVKLGIR